MPAKLPIHLPVPWVYMLVYLIGFGIGFLRPVAFPLRANPATVRMGGAIVFAIGAAIAGWGWITFHRVGTTKVPGEASTQLVTWGPYRFTRNPMYLGLAIAYIGEALIQQHVWPLVLFPLVIAYVNWIVIPVEQTNLEHVFGEPYVNYRRRVRRWL